MTSKNIKLVFKRDRVSAIVVAAALNEVENACYRADIADLKAVLDTLPELPAIAVDAMNYRIERYRGYSLHVTEVRRGSLILLGIAGGLAYWLVEKTLGETLKDAWKESELHEKLKRIFKGRLSNRAYILKKELEGHPHFVRKQRTIPYQGWDSEIALDYKVSETKEEILIEVIIFDGDLEEVRDIEYAQSKINEKS